MLLLGACGGGGSGDAEEPVPDGVSCGPTTFASGGVEVAAERCAPNGSSPVPVVGGAVVLGGCTSGEDDGLLERQLASSLATAGVVTLVPEYLTASDAPSGTFCAPTPEAIAGLPAVVGAVADGVAALRQDPQVAGLPVVAAGYSFGGLAALYASSGQGPSQPLAQAELAAMALFAAPTYPEVLTAAQAGALPPMLILQGEDDETVPVGDSTALEAAAVDGGTEVALVLVPGMDHGWSEDSDQARTARGTAVPDVVAFLVDALGGADDATGSTVPS
ncbi:MAG: dienelactone hydrolase family protein [Ilumatobacteraceae bacterium]